MCLLKKSIIPKITLKPKTVYKIINKTYNNEYYTHFTGDKVNLEKTYSGKFFKLDVFSFLFSKYIDSGFIHSYSEKNNLELTILEYKEQTTEKLILVKCEIPKFTLYYEGYGDEIASRRLKYIEVVEEL